MERFEGTVRSNPGGGHYLEVPFDPKEVFGRVRVPIRVTVHGCAYRTTLMRYRGVDMVGISKAVLAAAGLAAGDSATVEVELDDEPREVEVPPELAAVLAAAPDAAAAYDRLSYTHRREYAAWIAGAKREDTRARRAGQAVEMLRDGVRHP